MCWVGKPEFHSSYIGMNVCGSAYENGPGVWSMAYVIWQQIE